MTIEIRQVSVRSTIVDHRERDEKPAQGISDIAALKREMMDACRQLVEEMLREREER